MIAHYYMQFSFYKSTKLKLMLKDNVYLKMLRNDKGKHGMKKVFSTNFLK